MKHYFAVVQYFSNDNIFPIDIFYESDTNIVSTLLGMLF